MLIQVLLIIVSGLLSAVTSTGSASELVGTWSTKSLAVTTGPTFYNPAKEQLFEPRLTGISYTFDSEGHYEEALYRSLANPTEPGCPMAIMQWQHGSFEIDGEGVLTLSPIKVDGRQLLSDPCTNDRQSVYTRYNQTESFKSFRVYEDPYHRVMRLDLQFLFGKLMHPMYLAHETPQMLPTSTLTPVPV